MKDDTTGWRPGPALRADARRNRERILAAARDAFVEQGADAPLDAIAARAGVGIATLYRRFPDRDALTRAVVLDALTQTAAAAEQALAEEPDAFAALARYMRRALELRVSAVVPALIDRVSLEGDPEILAVRERSAELLQRLIDRAHAEGTLRPDVRFADVGLSLVRLARPLPGPIPRALDDDLAQRHLALLIDGLRADRAAPAADLPGPAMTRADLHALPPTHAPGAPEAATHDSDAPARVRSAAEASARERARAST